MTRKIIEVGTPGTRLSVSHRQLVIERAEQQRVTLPIEDLGVVVIDDQRAIYTQAVLTSLAAADVTLILAGSNHLPAAMLLPFGAHHAGTERHWAQVAASEPVRKRTWQRLVAAKIRLQGLVLASFTGRDAGLAAMAERVRSGDPENLEAQAAQRYWPLLFGSQFRRDRDADGVNAALNYGYAVIRAAVARAVGAAGLIPSFGVFHKNRSNPFCLADDLMEPYRPYVDWRVKLLEQEFGAALMVEHKSTRAALLSLLNEGVTIKGRGLPMLTAIEASAASLARALTGGDRTLALPQGLPLAGDHDEQGS